ncbi:glucose-6-phosphate 1-dehydrogenase-like, partial [Coturnix japonica]|uniref:glucose-6-phosphate 1-dehydrogenase-like n=1 Tax=Coturnix japonica TaxID=93934 RepID=UPI0007779F0B
MVLPHMKVTPSDTPLLEDFLSRLSFVSGQYGDPEDFRKLDDHVVALPGGSRAHRIFYLALPPSLYGTVSTNIRHRCMGGGWTRLIVEKPFGRDSASSQELTEQLSALFREEQLYRMDHYLGKEMVQSLMVL